MDATSYLSRSDTGVGIMITTDLLVRWRHGLAYCSKILLNSVFGDCKCESGRLTWRGRADRKRASFRLLHRYAWLPISDEEHGLRGVEPGWLLCREGRLARYGIIFVTSPSRDGLGPRLLPANETGWAATSLCVQTDM
jgi:hypothetical protein